MAAEVLAPQLEAKLAEVQQNLYRTRQNNGSFLEIANQEALAKPLQKDSSLERRWWVRP